ncbi:hypothetical protein SPURM210S_01663 [Streptomyces purpurascens]
MAAVATLMSMMTNTSIRWRPMRSPRWPQMMPPRGRKKKETAYPRKTSMMASSEPGKKTAASVPAMKPKMPLS